MTGHVLPNIVLVWMTSWPAAKMSIFRHISKAISNYIFFDLVYQDIDFN